MILLPLLGYVGLALSFIFLTLSIASGLYYLSELVEEHSVLSSRILRRLVYGVCALQLLLSAIDGFPWRLTLLGIASHALYTMNLRHFPIVKLSDPFFLASCAAVVGNHWMWMRYFSNPEAFTNPSFTFAGWSTSNDRLSDPYGRRDPYRYGSGFVAGPSFTEIASYFGICVWLVPFALFVSLSAGENVLPSMGSEYATGERSDTMASVNGTYAPKKGHRRRNTGLAKSAVNASREWVAETGAVMGWWRAENVRPV